MTYTILNDFKKHVIKCRQKRMRLRAMFQSVQKLRKFEGLSSLILLNCLVISLRELELPYSIQEVYSAFKLVDKNDYSKGQKKQLLKFLTNGSKNKSVF